jgi:hypothetical protein
MRLASGIRAGVFFLTILGFLVGQFRVARERSPRLEVRCPSAPVPVKLGEQQAFVYELHVSNFDSVPLTLNHQLAPAKVSRTGAFSNCHFLRRSYPSPPATPGASVHECHSSFSACASQNHLPHVGQCTVAGKSHGSSLGDTPWHKRSRFSLSPPLSPISAPLAAISTLRFYAPILLAFLG